jgi:iron complex outermembrane receptor protein
MRRDRSGSKSGKPDAVRRHGRTLLAWSAIAFALPAHPAMAQAGNPAQLAGASLEELMNIEVTSVSKKEQTLSKTGAAVFVIGPEDIRRSGANNIPDLLRMAPGVEVAQIDANQWAISIRGFNDLYSNKVLVLIDGRTVYVNSFSGVFWDQIDVPLENIERIEVIRGPGGTIWGANAVNGVINIITKSAADTKGGLVTAGAGSRQTADGLVQYGADAGSTGAYRVFGRYFNTDNSVFPGGQRAADGSHGEQAGVRSDWAPSMRDTLSVQGDFLSTEGGGTTAAVFAGPPPFATPVNNELTNTSGDILARWEHTLANGSSTSLQVYDNAMKRNEAGFQMTNNAFDVEFEHHLAAGSRNDVVWGLDYRAEYDAGSTSTAYSLHVNPPRSTDSLFAVFVQDEIRLSNWVSLTLGSKFEHNAFTGFEYEPSVQLVWRMNDRQSLWLSAARAIRQPDLFDYGVQFNLSVEPVPGYGPALVTINGSPAVRAEQLNDYEAGYRAQISRRLSLDVTTFLSYYHHLETQVQGTPYVTVSSGSPLLVLPLTFASLAHARDYGAEAFANWQVTGRWRLSPGFSMLRMAIQPDPAGQAGFSPRQQVELRSLFSLPKNLEWDGSIKYIGGLASQDVSAYTRLDMRLGWRLGESLEVSVSGQNLATRRHLEFLDDSGLFIQTEVARTVFAKLTWRY